jgi:hypothetical protein
MVISHFLLILHVESGTKAFALFFARVVAYNFRRTN